MIKQQQVCVGAAIFNQEDKLLLVQRSMKEEFMPGFWELPGGGSEYGETPQEALKREIQEECGLFIDVLKPLTTGVYFMSFTDTEIQRVEIIYQCKLIDKNQVPTLSFEHDDFQWIDTTTINSLELSEFMRKMINSSLESI